MDGNAWRQGDRLLIMRDLKFRLAYFLIPSSNDQNREDDTAGSDTRENI